jgi:hypothetical protein
MIGSATIGAWIALVLFWVLLGFAWAFNELSLRGRLVFVVLWVASNLTLRALNASDFFPPVVAVLDVVLVLLVFKGDVRLT